MEGSKIDRADVQVNVEVDTFASPNVYALLHWGMTKTYRRTDMGNSGC